ncbi:MAG: phosphate-starvation-inducible PsiE family protein [Nitrospirae bacterium]|nr:phosphate-starvation-inducible PsiE family protein [Nitrospirota bacterium]MDA1305321.1 phosphate-starvation-inducible PsiE family protein [Nitrospirota bacterium]
MTFNFLSPSTSSTQEPGRSWRPTGHSPLGHLLSLNMTDIWMQGIKVVLSLLIVTILTALAAGVLMTFLELHLLFSSPLEIALRQVIVNTLILLAIVEVFKTTLTYFSEGRVKVTFIVDTILVVMLTEIISMWFRDAPLEKWSILGGILIALAIIRVVAVQWSPTKSERMPEIG